MSKHIVICADGTWSNAEQTHPGDDVTNVYKLFLSLGGDVALLWPQQGFLPGLVSFLLAHLAYLWAFTQCGVRFAARPLPFVLYGALAALILA